MFVSAGIELKLHTCNDDGVENHPVQHPPSQSKIINVSFCNDNSYIAFLRENEKPQILSTKDRQNVRLIHTINVSNISALTFKHNTKKNIAMGSKTGDVIVYDTKSRNVSNVFAKVAETIKALDFTCDDQQLCGLDGNVFFVFPEINANNHLKKYKQASECSYLKCHPFIPNRVAVGCKNGRVGLWDVQSGVEMVHLDLLACPISGVSMSSCGNFLVAAGKDLKICGVDYDTGTCNFQYHLEQDRAVTSVDLSPDDKFLAVGLADGTLKLYDIKLHMKLVYSAKLHFSPVNIIAFENKEKECNSNFSSMMKLSDQELKGIDSLEACSNGNSRKNKSVKSFRSLENRDDSLEKLKKSLLKVIKAEMDCLENQLHEHCAKFQKFLDNEFDTIDSIIKKKWDIFNEGDMNQIVKAICPDDSKTEHV